MKRSLLFFVTILMMTTMVHAAQQSGGDTIKETFKVRSGGTLVIDIDRGSIEVKTITGNEVHVELERRIRGVEDDEIKMFLNRHQVVISQDGNSIIIDAKFDDENVSSWSRGRRRKDDRFELTVTVLVPETFNLDLLSDAGNVEIEDLIGSIVARIGMGNINIGDIIGSIDIVTGAGFIEINSIDGSVEVISGAGNIEINDVGGSVVARTGAGDVEVTITKQPRGDSQLSSGSGAVTVYMEEGIAVDVEARVSLGSAESAFGHKIDGKWMSKSFEGRVNGGGPALVIYSGVGSISLKRN